MGWTVILEDERREKIDSLNTEFKSEIFGDKSTNDQFKLINYLDPYGDLVFNHLQMNDLIFDLEKLEKTLPDDNITAIINLAIKCKSMLHSYLVFYGD